MKKKVIAIFAIFILSFNIMATARQEKTEASALLLSYAIFKAGVSFTAFTGFASLMAVNGYHMQLSDLAVAFADKYYDYANGVYIEKGSKINALEKLSLATASFISGNDPLTYSELDAIKNSVVEDFPQKLNPDTIIPDIEFNVNGTKDRFPMNYESFGSALISNNQGFYEIREQFSGKIVKILYSAYYPDFYYYADLTNYGWVAKGSSYVPTIRIITPAGLSIPFVLNDNNAQLSIAHINTQSQNFRAVLYSTGTSITQKGFLEILRDNYVGELIEDYTVVSDSFADGSQEFIKTYPNYYSALSGKAATTDELIGLMNTDEYLQREVAKLLENQKVNEQNTLQIPEVVDGVLTYPTADIPDVPDNSYTPTETWYNDLIGAVVGAPDVIMGGITDLWDNTIIPKINDLGATVGAIPDLLTTAWDTSMDVPMESINLDNLKLDGITQKFPFSIPFDYINLVQVLNVEPIEPDLSINLDTHYLKINHEIDINPISKYIRFFRWFVLLTFIYGLMMITRKVIKW